MENITQEEEKFWKDLERSSKRGKIAGGLLLITIGILYILKASGTLLPAYLFTWPMLLIGIAAVLAIKHGFRRPGWMVLGLVGFAFLMAHQYPMLDLGAYLWPAALILFGLMIVFKPRRKFGQYRSHWHKKKYGSRYESCDSANWAMDSSENRINVTNVFSGTKRTMISKELEGGEVTNVFGGAEINLLQADFKLDKLKLEINNVFGGTKLLIPISWELRSEMTTVIGGVEDQRPLPQTSPGELRKVLVLTGSNVFGGIEINTY